MSYEQREPYKRGGTIYEHIYEIELYPVSENLNFFKVLHILQITYPNCKFVYAFHDKDTKDDGTLKKPHYHLLIIFERERSIKALAHNLEVPENMIVWKQYLDKSVQYLIHMNNPEKYQYDIDILEGTLDFMQFFVAPQCSSERNELSTLIEFVLSNKDHITFYNIFTFARDNSLLYTYRRWYQQIKDIYKE